jgi:hypothetical protein
MLVSVKKSQTERLRIGFGIGMKSYRWMLLLILLAAAGQPAAVRQLTHDTTVNASRKNRNVSEHVSATSVLIRNEIDEQSTQHA